MISMLDNSYERERYAVTPESLLKRWRASSSTLGSCLYASPTENFIISTVGEDMVVYGMWR